MASPDANAIRDGLANVAHSVRRSTALYVAMSITEPGSSIDEMLATADRLAEWIRGEAGAQEASRQPWKPPE